MNLAKEAFENLELEGGFKELMTFFSLEDNYQFQHLKNQNKIHNIFFILVTKNPQNHGT